MCVKSSSTPPASPHPPLRYPPATGGALFQQLASLKPLFFPNENHGSRAWVMAPHASTLPRCLLGRVSVLQSFKNFITVIFFSFLFFCWGLSLDCFVGAFLTRSCSLHISTVNFLVQEEGEHRAMAAGTQKARCPRLFRIAATQKG